MTRGGTSGGSSDLPSALGLLLGLGALHLLGPRLADALVQSGRVAFAGDGEQGPWAGLPPGATGLVGAALVPAVGIASAAVAGLLAGRWLVAWSGRLAQGGSAAPRWPGVDGPAPPGLSRWRRLISGAVAILVVAVLLPPRAELGRIRTITHGPAPALSATADRLLACGQAVALVIALVEALWLARAVAQGRRRTLRGRASGPGAASTRPGRRPRDP